MWFEIYPTFSIFQSWRWRLKSPNGKILADSGEGYSTKAGCRRAISRIATAFQDGPAGVEVRYDD